VRAPSGTSSRIFPCAVTDSSTHSTFVSFTDIFPPSIHPMPKASCITCATKQVDIIPCTTMLGNPKLRACSRSVW
jgi:hypothetical protein